MSFMFKRGNVFQTWITCFVWIVLLGDLQGLILKTLNVCGDINYLIACPVNTVLIVNSVTILGGTTCKNESNCPSADSLKTTLVQDCFAKQYCDMNTTTTICIFNNGELGVEAACVKDKNVITQCTDQPTQLSSISGPIMVVTPGYPKLYNVSKECSNMINVNAGLYNGTVAIIDRYSPPINSYLCGTTERIEVRIVAGPLECDRLSTDKKYPDARLFHFTFIPFFGEVNKIRGILFEITADNVMEDDIIVPFLLKERPPDELETNTVKKEDSFLTPLVLVGITSGAAVLLLLSILICGACCRCCRKDSARKDMKNSESKPKPEKDEIRETETAVGAEAFFAGSKVEAPYSNNKDMNAENKSPHSDPESHNGKAHLYQNSGPVQSMTVTADVHTERTRPRGRRKPMKLPRKSKPPPASLHPIYENQSPDSGSPSLPEYGKAAYENVGYNTT